MELPPAQSSRCRQCECLQQWHLVEIFLCYAPQCRVVPRHARLVSPFFCFGAALQILAQSQANRRAFKVYFHSVHCPVGPRTWPQMIHAEGTRPPCPNARRSRHAEVPSTILRDHSFFLCMQCFTDFASAGGVACCRYFAAARSVVYYLMAIQSSRSYPRQCHANEYLSPTSFRALGDAVEN